MMAFPSMLFDAADQAKMARPPEDWNEDWTDELREQYPHFFCYCMLQLNRPITWGEHWENAKIIASIPDTKIKKMELVDFLAMGLRFQN